MLDADGQGLVITNSTFAAKISNFGILKNYTSKDYLLLSGDPSVIGIAVAIVSDINNGRFNLLKWDRQEKVYYPLEIDLYEKGKIDE